jgi:glycosyltransferase involved in cell wall biosynthesis
MSPDARFSVFAFYRDSPQRREALGQPSGAPERYLLFGLDELVQEGIRVRHNLERGRPVAAWARAADIALNRVLYGAGGYGGDFVSVLPWLRAANAADVVFATVDTVGIPVVLLARSGLVRPPVVYTAVGLPERLARLEGERMRRLYAGALRRARAIVAYSESEADRLRSWLGPAAPPVVFVPFGVDVRAFAPIPGVVPEVDVLSIGADPRRDFGLLTLIAHRRPEWRVRIVATADRARSLGVPPENVAVETDIPLGDVRDRLAGARVVALPVHENSYSGATTVLLQAMAMAKPVVVSRTEAIAHGYGLEDSFNCRLVEPGDADAFERAVLDLLADEQAAAALGSRARETAERRHSWDRYANAIRETLARAAGELTSSWPSPSATPSGRASGAP